MRSKCHSSEATRSAPPHDRVASALALCLTLLSVGCHGPITTHANALASATAPVVEQAAVAYSSANIIHNQAVDYEAVARFNDPPPNVYNPRTTQPLLSVKDIQVRLAVLAAFQEYVKSVVAITGNTDSPELQAASKSAAQNLTNLGNDLAPSIDSVLGIAAASAATVTTTTTSGNTTTSSTSSTPAPAITPGAQNGITIAIDALGQFLINRKTSKELPPIVVAMDPHVKTLCDLLQSDISTLKDQEGRDYDLIINQQTLFIRVTPNLDPEQRREQIMKLPAVARQKQASDLQLTDLSNAVGRLRLTHHAFAAQAQGNNPTTIKSTLSDLEAAGSDLGAFYKTLSPSQ
jgi:hypothetical protein